MLFIRKCSTEQPTCYEIHFIISIWQHSLCAATHFRQTKYSSLCEQLCKTINLSLNLKKVDSGRMARVARSAQATTFFLSHTLRDLSQQGDVGNKQRTVLSKDELGVKNPMSCSMQLYSYHTQDAITQHRKKAFSPSKPSQL